MGAGVAEHLYDLMVAVAAAYSQPPSVVVAEADIVEFVAIELANGVDDRCLER